MNRRTCFHPDHLGDFVDGRYVCDECGPLVVNLRSGEPYDIRVDRATRWGNPYIMGDESDRDWAIGQYRQHLWRNLKHATTEDLLEVAALAGKKLACWCAPLPCHADVLVAASIWASERLRELTSHHNKEAS